MDKSEDEHFERLGNYDERQLMEEGRKALLRDLTAKVCSGQATKDDKRLYRDLLKDNGLTLIPDPEGLPKPEKPAPLPQTDIPEGYD